MTRGRGAHLRTKPLVGRDSCRLGEAWHVARILDGPGHLRTPCDAVWVVTYHTTKLTRFPSLWAQVFGSVHLRRFKFPRFLEEADGILRLPLPEPERPPLTRFAWISVLLWRGLHEYLPAYLISISVRAIAIHATIRSSTLREEGPHAKASRNRIVSPFPSLPLSVSLVQGAASLLNLLTYLPPISSLRLRYRYIQVRDDLFFFFFFFCFFSYPLSLVQLCRGF